MKLHLIQLLVELIKETFTSFLLILPVNSTYRNNIEIIVCYIYLNYCIYYIIKHKVVKQIPLFEVTSLPLPKDATFNSNIKFSVYLILTQSKLVLM